MNPFMLRKKKKLVTVTRKNGLSARIGTDDYRMATIDSMLRRSLAGRGGDLVLTLDPVFQGLPDAAHGGSVLAAFDAVAALTVPRDVSGVYRKRVPLATPLRLVTGDADGASTFVLSDGDSVLVDGRVRATADDSSPGGAATLLRDPWLLRGGERGARETSGTGSLACVVEEESRRSAGLSHPLPLSRTCFACGVDNPLGLRARLEFDDAEVRGTWQPREAFRTAEGALATAAVTTLLDEAAFWLGALATGEAGMTTDLRVTLHASVPFGAALTVRGARAAVRANPGDGRYWDTAVVATSEDGRPVASARITFVAVRGAARRLVGGLLAMNDAALLRRVFPAYARPDA
jgi:acyl-coenzyme A thioesterase PaaI-like protein